MVLCIHSKMRRWINWLAFNYRIEDSKTQSAEKDLTVNTIASGAQIIASHPWKIISVIWETDDPPSENIQDCAKDDTWTYRRDSTIGINYGASGCPSMGSIFLTNGHSAKMKNIHPHLPFCIRCNKSYYRSLYGKNTYERQNGY